MRNSFLEDLQSEKAVLDHFFENLNFQFTDEKQILLWHTCLEDKEYKGFDMHYAFELGLIKSGRMTRMYNDHVLQVGPGDVWLTGIWEPHGFDLLETPCEVFVFIISPGFLNRLDTPYFNWTELFTLSAGHRPAAPQNRHADFLRIIDRLGTLAEPFKQLWLKIYLCELLLYLYEALPQQKQAGVKDLYMYQQLEPAIQLVFQSRMHIPVYEAARTCSMSRSSFDALFRTAMGISFPKFSLRFRLRSAADQIITGNDPLKAVADEWGFTDSSHFIKAFKEHYRMSPHEFRRNAQDKASL